MDITSVAIEKPEDVNIILGQSHFIKTIEDLYEAIVQTNPAMRFGIAFCEASGPALIRWVGNDAELLELAKGNANRIGAGHSFLICMRDGYPINILNQIKSVPEVACIFCATSNPVDVLLADNGRGRGIVGVIDGYKSAGIETEENIRERSQLLRKIGYKL